MKKLKERWNINTDWQLFIILLVFALTGSTSAKFAGPLTEVLGITDKLGAFIYWTIRVLIIFPIYQVLLVFLGWLFGEYEFFWNFEKKMLRRMKLGFLIKD